MRNRSMAFTHHPAEHSPGREQQEELSGKGKSAERAERKIVGKRGAERKTVGHDNEQ